MPGAWRFVVADLTAVVDEWTNRYAPSEDQRYAFYDWAMNVTLTGPPNSSVPTSAEDEYVAWVPAARVRVIFLAVEQDQAILLRRIDPE